MIKNKGFTLVEVLIVVVIIGILASIALPSYNQYTQNAAIADARASLLGMASAMEQHRAQNGSYLGAAVDGNDAGNARDNTGAPDIYPAQSPADGTANFNLTISAAAAGTYTLTATATGAAGITANDTVTLNSVGVKAGTGSLAQAWGTSHSPGDTEEPSDPDDDEEGSPPS